MIRGVPVEAVGTHTHAGSSVHEEEGLKGAAGSALLAVGGIPHAQRALGVAGVADVIGGVLVVAVGTHFETGEVGREVEGLVDSARCTLPAVGGA